MVSNEVLVESYGRLGSVWKVADEVGLSGQTVHKRLQQIGKVAPVRVFTDAEKDVLRAEYAAHADSARLQELADKMGRTKQFICRQAGLLGLTKSERLGSHAKTPESREITGMKVKAWIAANGHPKGALGMKHTPESKAKMSASSTAYNAGLTKAQKTDRVRKAMKTKVDRHGTTVTNRPRGSWKAGWREIGGQRAFFRSRWEANYARWLEVRRNRGEVLKWEHEPQTFWFDQVKRGAVSYLPDFRVTFPDGSVEYHEVKGWMDSRSKTKIRRMGKYHPDVVLVVIDRTAYIQLERVLHNLIEGWES